jgi:hypothetical protein
MIEEFYDETNGDDHERFQRWRRDNDEGFFINVKSSNKIMLHRVPCTTQEAPSSRKAILAV